MSSSSSQNDSSSPVLYERTIDTNFSVQGVARLTDQEAELAAREHHSHPTYIHYYNMNRIVSSPNVSITRAWMHILDTNVAIIDGKETNVERVKVWIEVTVDPQDTTLEVVDCSSDMPEYHHRHHEHTGKAWSPRTTTYPSFETARTVASIRSCFETQGSPLKAMKIAFAADYWAPYSWKDMSPSESKALDEAKDKLWTPAAKVKSRTLRFWAWYRSGVCSERTCINLESPVEQAGPLVRWGICRSEEQYRKDEISKRINDGRVEDRREKGVETKMDEESIKVKESVVEQESVKDKESVKEKRNVKDNESVKNKQREQSEKDKQSGGDKDSKKDSLFEEDEKCKMVKMMSEIEKCVTIGSREMVAES